MAAAGLRVVQGHDYRQRVVPPALHMVGIETEPPQQIANLQLKGHDVVMKPTGLLVLEGEEGEAFVPIVDAAVSVGAP